MKKLASIALVGLLLAGCTRYAALSPDQALSNAVAKLLEAKSFSASLDTKVDQIPFTSKLFSNTFSSVAAHVDIDYTRRYSDGDRLRVAFDARDASQERFAGELRFAVQELYFRLDELPDTGDLNLSSFTKEEFELPLGSFLPGFSTKLDEFSPLERAAAATVIRQTPDLFTGIQEIGDEEVEGRKARHYTARLNPDALERIAQQLAALGGTQSAPPLRLESISDQPLDLWVSTSGELVRLRGPFQGLQGRSGTLDLTIRNYNDRIQVEPFDESTLLDLDELTERLGSRTDTESNEDEETPSQPQNETEESDQTNESNQSAPGVDTGNSTTPYVPEVPFPIQ